MTNLDKQQVALALEKYCNRYESQNKAANSLKGVSSATISHMLKGNKQLINGEEPDAWRLIKDDMWRNLSAQIGYTDDEWVIAEIRDYRLFSSIIRDAKENASVSFVIGAEGTGKTETIKSFYAENSNVYFLRCNDFWTKKTFLSELLAVMGRNSSGYTMYEMMTEIIQSIKRQQDNPIIVLDEADKLNDQIIYFFITLYNNLEDHCGFILDATHYFKKRILSGIASGRKGYAEVYSRAGKKFIELKGLGSTDVKAICQVNGIRQASVIKEIYEDSENDIRRVKKKIRAYKKYVQGKQIVESVETTN